MTNMDPASPMDPPPPTFARAKSLPKSFKSPPDSIRKNKTHPMELAIIPPYNGGTESNKCVASETINKTEGIINGSNDDDHDDNGKKKTRPIKLYPIPLFNVSEKKRRNLLIQL
jgi:hypothetical protein